MNPFGDDRGLSRNLPLSVRLRDHALELAHTNGRTEPNVSDVLLSLCEMEETASVLLRRGVDVAHFARDLAVVDVFGWGGALAGVRDHYETLYRQVFREEVAGFREKVEAFADMQELFDILQKVFPEDHQLVWKRITSQIAKFATGPEVISHGQRHLMAKQVNEMLSAHLGKILTTLDGLKNGNEVAMALMAISHRLSIIDNEDVILFHSLDLESVKHQQPNALIDTIIRDLDEKFTYLLYRNGLIAPDDYRAPLRLPDNSFLDLLGKTHRVAQARRDPLITPAHLLMALIGDWQVSSLLRQAGIDDLHKLEKSFERALFGERENNEKFRHHPIVDEELQNLVDVIAEIAHLEGIRQDRGEEPKKGSKKSIITDLKKAVAYGDVTAIYGSSLLRENALLPAGFLLWLAGRPQMAEIFANVDAWKKVGAKFKSQFFESCATAADEQIMRRARNAENSREGLKISDRDLTNTLEEYATDLVAKAKAGKFDPVIGRDKELDDIINTLMRRNRANPIIVGEPGVGKTVLFEALAQRLARGDVPKELVGAQLHLLDMGKMQANTMFRGSFEGRLQPIIEGVQERNALANRPPIILCMDEAQAGMQAGAAQGTSGASETLKPFLSSRHSRTIAVVTYDDYRKHISKNRALSRRLTPVFVNEPQMPEAKIIAQGARAQFESHHGIKISDSMASRAVELGRRYLPDFFDPDKSVELIDAACVEARVGKEKDLREEHMLTVISRMTNLPKDFLSADDADRYLTLRDKLGNQVFDQQQATAAVADALVMGKARMRSPDKPLGFYAFVGPTGVGKTEVARALARELYGTVDALNRLDMGQYKERHSVSRLIGPPPGYVGYEDDGTLTGPVRRRPFNVTLMDEFEKAHDEIFTIIMPVAEDGVIYDMAGRRIDFRNTLLIQSMNLEAQTIFNSYPDPEKISEEDRVIISSRFIGRIKDRYPPEYLNRLDGVIVFYPLTPATMLKIANREIGLVKDRAKTEHGIIMGVDNNIISAVAKRGYDPEFGARPLKRIVDREIIKPFSYEILKHMANKQPIRSANFNLMGESFKLDIAA